MIIINENMRELKPDFITSFDRDVSTIRITFISNWAPVRLNYQWKYLAENQSSDLYSFDIDIILKNYV